MNWSRYHSGEVQNWKAFLLNHLLCAVLLAGVGFGVSRAAAQVFTPLHTFVNYNAEGSTPFGRLVLSSNMLYGTTKFGGSDGSGVVFGMRIDGALFTNLHNFLGVPDEGGFPEGDLLISSNVLYGLSREGALTAGTLFKVNTDGSGFASPHNFYSLGHGEFPRGALVLSGNVLYGTAVNGGNQSRGTIFRVNIDGSGFTNLHNFTQLLAPTNYDGAHPYGGLVLSGNKLFGTASGGGNGGAGTVFVVNTDGSGFATLHSFSAPLGSYPFYTNNDGATPKSALVVSGDTLYGTTQDGGTAGAGAIFAIKTNGSGFTNLHSFSAATGSGPYHTNSDGVFPQGTLALNGNTLYGTAYGGGNAGLGTLFSISTDGNEFSVLHTFFGSNGENPVGGLIFADNTLYGTTTSGGFANGTVFSFALAPPTLKISRLEEAVVLNWPLNAVGYTLESTTNLVSPMFWNPVAEPVLTDGEYSVITPTSAEQTFYRLRH